MTFSSIQVDLSIDVVLQVVYIVVNSLELHPCSVQKIILLYSSYCDSQAVITFAPSSWCFFLSLMYRDCDMNIPLGLETSQTFTICFLLLWISLKISSYCKKNPWWSVISGLPSRFFIFCLLNHKSAFSSIIKNLNSVSNYIYRFDSVFISE